MRSWSSKSVRHNVQIEHDIMRATFRIEISNHEGFSMTWEVNEFSLTEQGETPDQVMQKYCDLFDQELEKLKREAEKSCAKLAMEQFASGTVSFTQEFEIEHVMDLDTGMIRPVKMPKITPINPNVYEYDTEAVGMAAAELMKREQEAKDRYQAQMYAAAEEERRILEALKRKKAEEEELAAITQEAVREEEPNWGAFG